MSYQLSKGAPRMMLDGRTDLKPTLQCNGVWLKQSPKEGVRLMQSPNQSQRRYRIALSDGDTYCTAMMATQLNDLAAQMNDAGSPVLQDAIVRLDDYLCNELQGRRVIIILALVVLGASPPIGQPVNIDPPKAQRQGVQPPAQGGVAPGGAAGGYGAQPPPQQQQRGPYGQQPQQSKVGGYSAPQPGLYQNGARPAGNAGVYGAGGGAAGSYGQQQQQQTGAYSSGYGQQQHGAGGHGGGGTGGYGGVGIYGTAPTPQYRAGGAPIARNEAPPKLLPIAALNSYQTRWTIKARVTQKSDMRRFSGAKGEGKVFSFDLVDANGGEIRCTAFNDTAERFFQTIQPGNVYTLSKASLKPKNARFNQTNHEYEITLENASIIQQVVDEPTDDIPRVNYNFRPVADIQDAQPGAILDVCGVVESCEAPFTLTRKDGTDAVKRALTIRDDSGASIELTLWGAFTATPGEALEQAVASNQHPILAVKAARVGDFNGRSLSTISTSLVDVDPDHEAAGRLRNWYDAGGAAMQAAPLSLARGAGGGKNDRRVFLAQIQEESLGSLAPAYVVVNAAISYIKSENMVYPACTLQSSGRQCAKKTTDNGDGTWMCDKCGQTCQPEWRYILTVRLEDHTGAETCTAFQDVGQTIMGLSAGELHDLEAAGSQDAIDRAIQSGQSRQLLFKLKVASQTYNDESMIKKSILRVDEIQYAKESEGLLTMIKQQQQGQPIMQAPAQGQQQQGYGAAGDYGKQQVYGVSGGMQQGPIQGGGYQGAAAPPGNRAGYGAPYQQNTYRGGGGYQAGRGGYASAGGF